MDSNELTKTVIRLLLLHHFNAWRQNNLAVKGRKFIGKKGVPDVIGFCRKTGTFIGVEIKTGRDKLSEEQKELHEQMEKAGAIIIVASDSRQFLNDLIEQKARILKKD